MIQANELRIGNLVNDRGGKTLEIHYWERAGMVAMNQIVGGITVHPLTEMCEHLESIPLTEDWLLKFGFEQKIDKNYIDRWILNKNFYLVEANGYNYNGTHYVKCEYVHQLQNLYFALTGEELKTTE